MKKKNNLKRMPKKNLPKKKEEVLKKQKVCLRTKSGGPNCGGSSKEATIRPGFQRNTIPANSILQKGTFARRDEAAAGPIQKSTEDRSSWN